MGYCACQLDMKRERERERGREGERERERQREGGRGKKREGGGERGSGRLCLSYSETRIVGSYITSNILVVSPSITSSTHLRSSVGHAVCDVSYQPYHILGVKNSSNAGCHISHQTHWVAEEIHRAQDLDGLTSDSLGSGGMEGGRKGGREGGGKGQNYQQSYIEASYKRFCTYKYI